MKNFKAVIPVIHSTNIEIELEPYDQSWGNREMYLNDPDGNKLRFVQEMN